MKIVFATSNSNKIKEVQTLLPNSIEIIGLEDIGCHEEVPETSNTIEGNALQKANYVFTNYNIPCFADDTGLEVETLNGEPGVFSARYAGEEKNSEKNMQKLLNNLKEKDNRSAQFKTVIALVGIETNPLLFEGICEGEITKIKKGAKGFGYDPVFKPINFDKTFAEMTINEKNKISHRGKAVQLLIDFFRSQ